MNATDEENRRHLLRMEALLARLLRYGAIVAGGWIVLGLAFSDRFLATGIVMLIALPVLRVALMMIIFAMERDYRFAAISAAVLAIIAVGFVLGALGLLS